MFDAPSDSEISWFDIIFQADVLAHAFVFFAVIVWVINKLPAMNKSKPQRINS